MIARPRPSQRRLDAFDWRGPPDHVGPSDDELRVIAAYALKRFDAARLEMALDRKEKSV